MTNECDFNDDDFAHSKDYDKNGIFYWLGTNYGQKHRWRNPAILGRIELKSSGHTRWILRKQTHKNNFNFSFSWISKSYNS